MCLLLWSFFFFLPSYSSSNLCLCLTPFIPPSLLFLFLFSFLKVGLVVLLDLINFLMTWKHAPYILLAQSRAEMNTTLCSLVVYIAAFLPAVKLISPSAAAAVMVPVQFYSLINNILTQMFPMFEKLLGVVEILLAVMVFRKRQYKVGDVVYSMVKSTGPNIMVEKSWCKRVLCCRMNKPFQHFADVSMDDTSELDGNMMVNIADEGVVIGECSQKLFPDDYDERMLVKFQNGVVLGLLTSDITRECGLALEKEEKLSGGSMLAQRKEKAEDSRQIEMTPMRVPGTTSKPTDSNYKGSSI
jgi:hypothetical protein